MKKILRSAWIVICVLLLCAFLVSCFSSYIPPSSFSFIPLFAIGFPYLFVVMLLCCFINLFTLKKLGLIIMILLLPGLINLSHIVAFNFSSDHIKNKNDSTLRIMTWNVQDFINLTPNAAVRVQMLQLIKEQNPDILCVQEFTNIENSKHVVGVQQELESLGFTYHFYSNDEFTIKKNKTTVVRGSAIFSKIPFTDSGRINIRNKTMNENLIYTNLNFDDRPLRIYTTHLASFQFYIDTDNINKDVYEITYDRKKVIQYKLREIELLHQKEAAIIKNAISTTSLPVIYCGDMNSVPSSYTYRFLKNNLQDAFLEKGSGIGTTFYKILPMLRIDYCFADKQFSITQCTVINKKLSDHYPVITDMQWK